MGSPVLQGQLRCRRRAPMGGKGLTQPPVCSLGCFYPCVEITDLEFSLILWEVKKLSQSALPHHREHKLGEMRSMEYNAQKKETARDWGRGGEGSAGSRMDFSSQVTPGRICTPLAEVSGAVMGLALGLVPVGGTVHTSWVPRGSALAVWGVHQAHSGNVLD